MSQRVAPATRRELIKFLAQRGWIGPRPGGNHEFMIKGPIGRSSPVTVRSLALFCCDCSSRPAIRETIG